MGREVVLVGGWERSAPGGRVGREVLLVGGWVEKCSWWEGG